MFLSKVGHTTPGTLALKFAKYQGNSVVLQPSTIKEEEFHLAFTQQYIEKLRNEAPRMGDQLMRVLLTLTENGPGVFVTEKVEVRGVMDYSIGHGADSSCHPPVMETGMPKWSDASDSQHFLLGNWSGQEITTAGRQPVERSSRTSINNPAYPPLMQAVRDDPSTPVTGAQSEDHPSNGNNPPYPPLVQAVRDNVPAPVTSHQSEEISSSGNNPPYPTLMQGVRDEPPAPITGHQSEEHSSTGNNPPYPPLVQAVRNDSPAPVLGHHSEEHSSSGNNPPYPPVIQAVTDCPLTPFLGHQSEGHSASSNNPPYPPIIQAVRDGPPTALTAQQSEERSGGSVSNLPYPPLMQAVRDEQPTPATGDQSDEHSTSGNRCNPPMISSDDPTTTLTGRDPFMPDDDLELF